MKGSIDDRPQELRDVPIHHGYDVDCGTRGGKLSGGQK